MCLYPAERRQVSAGHVHVFLVAVLTDTWRDQVASKRRPPRPAPAPPDPQAPHLRGDPLACEAGPAVWCVGRPSARAVRGLRRRPRAPGHGEGHGDRQRGPGRLEPHDPVGPGRRTHAGVDPTGAPALWTPGTPSARGITEGPAHVLIGGGRAVFKNPLFFC